MVSRHPDERIELDCGGSCGQVIELAAEHVPAPAVHWVLILHAAFASELPAIRVTREVAARYAWLPRRCADCDGDPPVAIRPPDGFTAAVLCLHSNTCPFYAALLRRQEGGSS
jgi:hypothetical protein